MTKPHIFILFVLCLPFLAKAQYITVNDTYTKEQLVRDVLINNTCASVSNISVLGGNFASGQQSYGYFNAGSSTFPFADGIVLSTGRAVAAQGPNSSLLDDGQGMDWPGDTDLEAALEINNSINATILEFDFIPLGNKISFDYILSSEEYHDNAPCRYSDGFAFLLKEVGGTGGYKNLAVVPGTTIPVKVTSVHPEIGGNGGCEAQNEEYFGAFNGFEHPTNFNGQTVALTALSDVTPGVLYHIKLVVADEGNYRYDSAIFLGGGSFKIETDLGEDRLLATGNPLCKDETLPLNATNANAIRYEWYKDTVLQPEITPTYPVTVAGTYAVRVELTGGCFSTGEIKVEYAGAPAVSNAVLVQCDEDNNGLALFNLNQADAQVIAGDPTLTDPVYFRTNGEAASNTNPITNVTNFENTQPVVYARAENQYGCYAISEVTLNVSNNNIADPQDLKKCDTDTNPTDGKSVFNLRDREAAILANLPSGNINYYTSYEDALSGLNPIPAPDVFPNTIPFQQRIYAKLSSGIDCYGIAEFNVIVNSFGNSLNDVQAIVCRGGDVLLNAGSGFSSYKWNTPNNETTQTIRVTAAGTYTVTVTNSDGCEGTKKFIVTASSIATVASMSIRDFQGGNNSATVVLTSDSIGTYQYSLDGITFQDSPTFTNLDPGRYTVIIKEANCGIITHVFYIMDYPKFFTPNNDGTNDMWRIPYLQFQPNATVAIFDRYGKLLYFFKGGQPGWDGKLNGYDLPANDYWFRIILQDKREIRGHFSLLR
ncbi:gliding motility-associated-like protein [Flavobacterium gossypii]|uniref:Gliding motility-associated-like protein n=1 Tax=Flavobacterium gossypii TaxID=1646119 RepID=A0ABR6DN58_9FLAO|nr:choice-of-anchor L domain-containing protein [Flavobacterium gossypii]MBA9072335.1 gliding motility-associated-like protein [Flavobacterium gossypii]